MQFLRPISIVTVLLCRGLISARSIPSPILSATSVEISTFETEHAESSTKRAAIWKRDVTGPENYDDDIDAFMYDQTRSGKAGVNLIPEGDNEDPATALEYEFRGHEWNMAVNNLEGCTMLIVISENLDRLWAAHFFEVPGFSSGHKFFKDKIIAPMLNGNPDPAISMPGLLPNKERFGSKPVTILISTRKWLSDEPHDFKYKNELDEIEKTLRRLWPNMPATIPQEYEKQILDSAYDRTALGKLLIQYGPGLAGGMRQAMVRVWLEDWETPVHADYWNPKSDQIAPS